MSPSKEQKTRGRKQRRKKCDAPKKSGGLCKRSAGWGTLHTGYGPCLYHGGKLPSVITAIQREMAGEAVETYGLPREVTPEQALLEEIWRTAGHVAWLELKVKSTEEEDLAWGTVEVTTGEHGHVKEAAKPNVWLTLYHKERQHLVDVCRVAIAAGIAERQVKLAEQQGEAIAQVLRGTLADLGIDDDKKVAKALRKNLMLVSGAAT